MTTYHIHIKGLVQGVGFRPHVYRLATEMQVRGWVNNTTNGVHIMATAEKEVLQKFYEQLIQHPPVQSKILSHHAEWVALQPFDSFYIHTSENSRQPDLMVTPDFGLCENCKTELFDSRQRRFRYPFITCTECGPRFSIITSLPYDREQTTMQPFDMCWQCRDEYHRVENRRYYSQTNSCATCGIPMMLKTTTGERLSEDYEEILQVVNQALQDGKIIAVKGIGGYLLLCDATRTEAVKTLRERKHRPSRPLALLYPDLQTVEKDVVLSPMDKRELQSVQAPIVLCRVKENPENEICTDWIAPGLQRIGVMLPYAPLLALIASDFTKPLIATSGNVSGSPILFQDEEAQPALSSIADLILSHERDIVVPQDDSVLQFSEKHEQKIILRRSRGLAPNYFSPSISTSLPVLAMGAEMKSSFALLDQNRCYVSQYLGAQDSYEAQQSYQHTLQHLTSLLKFEPEIILVDAHPDYAATQLGKTFGKKNGYPVLEVQHHKAHFAAVLAENDLIEISSPVLGVVWDGTGLGDDGNSWGGEFFLYHERNMRRVAHLSYFPVLSGDKMAREPRLSAFSLLHQIGEEAILKNKFAEAEWNYYQQAINSNSHMKTSSVGRFLDGVSSLLGLCDRSGYEGEAAMLLEAHASSTVVAEKNAYPFHIAGDIIYGQPVWKAIIKDVSAKVNSQVIAARVHLGLAWMVQQLAQDYQCRHIAFSGGVFQNALLTDMMMDTLKDFRLFFHRQLSPNDECISFGQLAYLQITEMKAATNAKKKVLVI